MPYMLCTLYVIYCYYDIYCRLWIVYILLMHMYTVRGVQHQSIYTTHGNTCVLVCIPTTHKLSGYSPGPRCWERLPLQLSALYPWRWHRGYRAQRGTGRQALVGACVLNFCLVVVRAGYTRTVISRGIRLGLQHLGPEVDNWNKYVEKPGGQTQQAGRKEVRLNKPRSYTGINQ